MMNKTDNHEITLWKYRNVGVVLKANCPKCKRRIRIRRNKRVNPCKCGYRFSYKIFGDTREIYLVDANIFLYAIHKDQYRGKHCADVLMMGCIATTSMVIKEVKEYNPFKVKIYEVKKISPEVMELSFASLKQPSLADKSLIQCAIDNPEICGIITNDLDISNAAPQHLIHCEKSFFVGRANEFLKRKGWQWKMMGVYCEEHGWYHKWKECPDCRKKQERIIAEMVTC